MYYIPHPPIVHVIPQKHKIKKQFECVCAPPLKEKVTPRR
jgi:hypothetical protein